MEAARDFQIGVLAREGEDASVIVSEDDNIEHVIPEWLKNDRDFLGAEYGSAGGRPC